MASVNADFEMRLRTLRQEILSYKPGGAIPCDDKRVVFPRKLVIGKVNLPGRTYNIVHGMRRALHGDLETSRLFGERRSDASAANQVEKLTDSISIIENVGLIQGEGQHLAGQIGCMVLVAHLPNFKKDTDWISRIERFTGRIPLCAIGKSKEDTRNELTKIGITIIYDLPRMWRYFFTNEERLQWLELLHGCLCEADVVLQYRNPAIQQICDQDGRAKIVLLSSEVNADFDGILKAIAKALYKNSDIDDLGSALGFESADIGRYIDANAQQGGNYMGTVDMLRTWRKGQTGSTEKVALREALLKVRFVYLANQYLSTGNPTLSLLLDAGSTNGSTTSSEISEESSADGTTISFEIPEEPCADGTTTSFEIADEPASEKLCCFLCCCFSNSSESFSE